ncbi:hypothetical protein N9P41_00455 [Pseudomonadales bacterium]|nr:hypothetical protein [Pseudomonadales bacterium]
MKKLSSLFSILAMMFAMNAANADDNVNSNDIVGFVYNFNVSNPAGVVEALTEYWSSPVGKKNPATAILRQIVSNGDDPATHSIAVVYSSMEEIDQTNALNNGTKEMQNFLAKMSAASTLTSEGMFWSTGVTSGNPAIVPAPGRYTIATSLAVSDPAAYVPAWQKYTAAVSNDSTATNLFGLNGMGTEPSTHVVTVSANSMAELFPQNPQMQAELSSLAAKVKDIRTIENRVLYLDLAVFSN